MMIVTGLRIALVMMMVMVARAVLMNVSMAMGSLLGKAGDQAVRTGYEMQRSGGEECDKQQHRAPGGAVADRSLKAVPMVSHADRTGRQGGPNAPVRQSFRARARRDQPRRKLPVMAGVRLAS